VRKLLIIESLGAVDIICTDKTGTLTEGKMSVRKVCFNRRIFELSYPDGGLEIKGIGKNERKWIGRMFEASAICNNASSEGGYLGAPTEVALLRASEAYGIIKNDIDEKWKRVGEVSFSSERKMMSTVNVSEEGRFVFSKGAPFAILKNCNRIMLNGRVVKLDKRMVSEMLAKETEMALDALRVIAVAYKEIGEKKEAVEKGLIFLGLEGMMDPPRDEVSRSIAVCRMAGITPVMITGDNLVTAKAVAKRIGLEGRAMEGNEIEEMDDSELERIVTDVRIFARTIPQHKFRILKALQKNDYVVAMTGDGVNDAPALKQADIGIAMGIKGTDVSRQASDIVLLDDNFATIVDAVEEGRTIFGNIRKFLNYLFICNFAEVFVVFFASFAGILPLKAVHILWINLVTDGMPAVALGADPPRTGTMLEKPAGKRQRIVDRRMVATVVLIGLEMTLIILGVFFIALQMWGLPTAITTAFTAFIVYEFLKIVAIREVDKTPLFSNKWLNIALMASLLLQLLVIYGPFAGIFGVVPLGIEQWLLLIAGGIIGYPVSFLLMRALRKRKNVAAAGGGKP
jgi:Ca2+-transporting ATPase